MRNEVRSMHLGTFLFNLGNHVAAWRHPDTPPAGLMDLRFSAHLAQVAERGCFASAYPIWHQRGFPMLNEWAGR